MSLNINKKGPNKGLLLYGYTKDRKKAEEEKRQKAAARANQIKNSLFILIAARLALTLT